VRDLRDGQSAFQRRDQAALALPAKQHADVWAESLSGYQSSPEVVLQFAYFVPRIGGFQ
jgi:hypothetical protein